MGSRESLRSSAILAFRSKARLARHRKEPAFGKMVSRSSTLGLTANFASGFYKACAGSLPFFSLVVIRFIPGAGIEPARDYSHRILSPVCLPIPPSRRIFSDRRRPDSNRRSSFCRAMPYHLATTPIVTLDRLKYEGLVSNGN